MKDAAERIIRTYRKEVVERQQELERLSDMAIELFATACVLARTEQLLAERGVEACERELELCDLFVIEAGRRFRASRTSLESVQDEVRRSVAARVRADGGYGVEDAILPEGLDHGETVRPYVGDAPSPAHSQAGPHVSPSHRPTVSPKK
jgi:acyl-CoA dehydrogenase family protein 9